MIQQLCGAVFAAVAVAAGYPRHLTGGKKTNYRVHLCCRD